MVEGLKERERERERERREAKNRSYWAESERESHKDNRVTELGFFLVLLVGLLIWVTIELFCFVYCLSLCH